MDVSDRARSEETAASYSNSLSVLIILSCLLHISAMSVAPGEKVSDSTHVRCVVHTSFFFLTQMFSIKIRGSLI